MTERSEQELVRRAKLERLRQEGYPFPNDFVVNARSKQVHQEAESVSSQPEESRPVRALAGRVMSMRLMGKAAFFHLQDREGRVQVYVKKDDVGESSFEKFKEFDLGDIVGVEGFSFLTKTGEPSLHAKSVRLLVKCLHPLPEKWHGLTDIEVRYRQRYLDLMVNPEVQEMFLFRAKVIAEVRKFFDERDYIEVETPMMNQVSGGTLARPFVTHHNTLDLTLYMRIALELPLKRLVVGGLERVYEIGRVFRNEGFSTAHNPEFTMLEFYEAYATYENLIDMTEELLVRLCDTLKGTRQIPFGETTVDYSPPYPRITMLDAIHELGGVPRSYDLNTTEGVLAAAKDFKLVNVKDVTEYGKLLFELFDHLAQKKIVNPTFITRHPLAVSPLSRPSMDDPRFVDRFELFICGMELANAFSELNDPEDQEERFRQQLLAKEKGDEEAMDMDEDFVRALEYGMPPTAGQGIGIDRLVMILSGASSIRDVILFPQMRPQHQNQAQEKS